MIRNSAWFERWRYELCHLAFPVQMLSIYNAAWYDWKNSVNLLFSFAAVLRPFTEHQVHKHIIHFSVPTNTSHFFSLFMITKGHKYAEVFCLSKAFITLASSVNSSTSFGVQYQQQRRYCLKSFPEIETWKPPTAFTCYYVTMAPPAIIPERRIFCACQ